MARAHITFRNAVQVGGSSILARAPRAAQTIDATASSQATTITGQSGEVASIVATGGDIFIAVGASPTAASGAGDLVPSGSRIDIGTLNDLDKIAVINA